MSPILGVLLIATTALVFPLSSQQLCTKNSDCSVDQCCLLGPSRYAIPSCMAFQQKDEQCRPNAKTITTNLTYPDYSQLEVKDVSFILCPCVDGTSCNPKKGYCN